MKTESLEPLINKGFAAHRILLKLKGSHGIIVPVPTHSLGLEELDFFGSEIGDMKSATAELSKRNGLEPPKDLNNEH